ncbi:MAG: 1-deoxy-D-xylulose-5-phosphate reductoisomerase [Gammaproteobacteria bacterium]|nr:1-deoxy-D-xylulose-5-phosphate reductoisomerase [Gammaproteobacteria bacterium]
MTGVTILGATGSIGVNTLDVLARHPDRFEVMALTARNSVDTLYTQCLTHRPRYAVMAEPAAAEQLRVRLRSEAPEIEVLSGQAGLETVAALPEVDTVMAAIVGAAGLLPTLAAVRAGKRVLLANKEALVMAGKLFMDAVRTHDVQLLPIDSEHNAVFQCLPHDFRGDLRQAGVRRIVLTASGGPFRTTPLEQLPYVTPAQACAHPNWVMGRKISVDSATMMNKGLEVIEACWLFNATLDQVDVVLHPQSMLHSLVEYVDGSLLAELGSPDMRTPITHALGWPERLASPAPALSLLDARLDFAPIDHARFPCLQLAYQAHACGGTASVTLNAANEVAVAAFLDGHLSFTGIPEVIERTLASRPVRAAASLEVILEDDAAARIQALQHVRGCTSRGGSLAARSGA